MKEILRLGKTFELALNRALIIIGHGDVPVYLESSKANESYKLSKFSLIRLIEVAWILAATCFKSGDRKYDLGSKLNVIYCGSTKNNIREFVFFDEFLPGEFSYSNSKNISLCKKRKSDISYESRILKIVVFVTALTVLMRCKINPTVVHYFVSCMKCYFVLHATFGKNASALPVIAVVANDHSSYPVVFSKIMEMYNVPRVYIQHAQVSSRFPPLDFEFSILRDEISEAAYNKIKPLSGRGVYVVSRYKQRNGLSLLSERLVEPINVILYLSSVFDMRGVQEAIDVLKLNEKIKDIGVKLHPRTKIDSVHFDQGIRLHQETPNLKHIAIVPNSSIVIELIHAGVPVVQYFGFDCIDDDYYGFVSSGIVEKVRLDELAGDFWLKSIYDDVKYQAYEKFNPSGSVREANDRSVLLEKFKALLL